MAFVLMGFLCVITSPPMWMWEKIRKMIFTHNVLAMIRKGESIPIEYLPRERYWLLKKESSEDRFFLFLDFFGNGNSIKVEVPKIMFDNVEVLSKPYDIIYEPCENEVCWRYYDTGWSATGSNIHYSKFEEILLAQKVIRRILF